MTGPRWGMRARPPDSEPVPGSVFAFLGPGPVAMLCCDWAGRVLADDRLYPWHHRAGPAARARMRAHHAGYLADVLGGPSYQGDRSLGAAHAPLRISIDAFALVLEHLTGALRCAGVEEGAARRVVARLHATHTQIVTAGHPPRRSGGARGKG